MQTRRQLREISVIGFFVNHATLKLGKVVRADFSIYAVHFFIDGTTRQFEKSAFTDGDLSRIYLPPETECRTSDRGCRIDQVVEQIRNQQPVVYLVTTDDGLQLQVKETELVPTAIVREDPVTSLSTLQQEGYTLFASRSELVDAAAEVVRQGGGLTALLSSRIDMRPHQAYVAGVVLQDRLRRYILADEVGLGKTIEAGIIVQDLLSSCASAKVLVICPGALTQQWLCEFYTKFSTRVFTLLDLYATPDRLSPDHRRTVIAPLHAINGPHRTWLKDTPWDLVIVDEVHHLLVADEAYSFVKELSESGGSILLLSALPAQQRKTEFLRLLALLEPDRYSGTPPDEFDRLYDAQPEIGRHLRRLRRRLEESQPDPIEIKDVVSQAIAVPALQGDQVIQAQGKALLVTEEGVERAGLAFLRAVADRSRINRRIVRNRRERLVDDGLIEKTVRSFLPTAYDPGQPEIDAVKAAVRLARTLHGRLDSIVWSAFGRVLMHSFAHPETAVELLLRLKEISPRSRKGTPELLGHLAGTTGWEQYRDSLLGAARSCLSGDDIAECIEAADLWRHSQSGLARTDALVELIDKYGGKYKKIVIFAGYPGLLDHLIPPLHEAFEPESVCVFHTDMSQNEKEANVDRFRSDNQAYFLISDESGGEGRNFQFAGAVVHYDTPWYASRIEQRIGRLDRIGRSTPGVPVSVLFSRGTVEEDFIKCLAEGFRIYERSVSGLEFSLRELELGIVNSLLGPQRRTAEELVFELREQVEQERVREENEAVLDEASFNREVADRYRRSNTLADAELRLERAFTEFIWKVATGKPAREKYDREFPKGIWEFETAQFQHIKVKFPSQGNPEQTTTPKGTFRRQIAQARLDLQFFSVGHPFFDGIMNAVRTEQCGRVYAVDIALPNRPEWFGFEFVLLAVPDLEPLCRNSGLVNRATRIFTAEPLHLFVDGSGKVEANGDDLLKLRRELKNEEKDRTWWNLTKKKAIRVPIPFGSQDAWRRAVQNAHSVALAEAKRQFEERIGHEVEMAHVTLADQQQQAEQGDPRELDGLKRLEHAIQNWRVVVDGIGFLSVNNQLGRGQ